MCRLFTYVTWCFRFVGIACVKRTRADDDDNDDGETGEDDAELAQASDGLIRATASRNLSNAPLVIPPVVVRLAFFFFFFLQLEIGDNEIECRWM